MLVYDICNEKSFENIKNWIRNIEEVGNKTETFTSLVYTICLNICIIVYLEKCTWYNVVLSSPSTPHLMWRK